MRRSRYLTPVVTAFDSQGNLDLQANVNIWDFLIKGGVDGIVVMGSSGEACSMTMKQREDLIELATSHILGKTKLYIGTGCMRSDETVELSNLALEKGADAVMIISPYYFALSAESVEFFYDHVAGSVTGDIYLYNYPARTGYYITPQITLNLLRRHSNIVGYKDSVSDFSLTRKLLDIVSPEFPDFLVYSGFDENFAHNVLSGGAGCIGALSNIYPEIFAELVKFVNSGNIATIARLQRITNKMMDIYAVRDTFMPVLKKAMQLRGVDMTDYCLSPLLQVNEMETDKIKAVMDTICSTEKSQSDQAL